MSQGWVEYSETLETKAKSESGIRFGSEEIFLILFQFFMIRIGRVEQASSPNKPLDSMDFNTKKALNVRPNQIVKIWKLIKKNSIQFNSDLIRIKFGSFTVLRLTKNETLKTNALSEYDKIWFEKIRANEIEFLIFSLILMVRFGRIKQATYLNLNLMDFNAKEEALNLSSVLSYRIVKISNKIEISSADLSPHFWFVSFRLDSFQFATH